MPLQYSESEYIAGLKRGARFRTLNYMGSLLSSSLEIKADLLKKDIATTILPIRINSSIRKLSLYGKTLDNAKVSLYMTIRPEIFPSMLNTNQTADKSNLPIGTLIMKQSTPGAQQYTEVKLVEEAGSFTSLFTLVKNRIENSGLADAEKAKCLDVWDLNSIRYVYLGWAIETANLTDAKNMTLIVENIAGSPSEMSLNKPMIEPIPGSNIDDYFN